jgi:hypothetical protein
MFQYAQQHFLPAGTGVLPQHVIVSRVRHTGHVASAPSIVRAASGANSCKLGDCKPVSHVRLCSVFGQTLRHLSVGIGDLLVQGCGGTKTLRGVLYVPDLAVSSACASMSSIVKFCLKLQQKGMQTFVYKTTRSSIQSDKLIGTEF